MNNKKIYITIAIIIAVLLMFIIILKINSKNRNNTAVLTSIDFSEVFELEDIKNKKYDIKKANNEKIAIKYNAVETYILNANVELNGRKGKMIYVRDINNKMNIYQTKYRIDDLDYANGINKYIANFLENASTIIGIDQLQIEDGIIFGEENKPQYLEESIYTDKKLYTFHHEEQNGSTDNQDKKKYDINFYMNENYLMCEIVVLL